MLALILKICAMRPSPFGGDPRSVFLLGVVWIAPEIDPAADQLQRLRRIDKGNQLRTGATLAAIIAGQRQDVAGLGLAHL
jgi:hypothetical protein